MRHETPEPTRLDIRRREPAGTRAESLPPGGKFTHRDQANVLTLLAFRNGPIEDLHAGKYSPLLKDPELSRITDEEMKTIMIAASAKLAELLALRDQDPDGFAQLLAANWRQVSNWER